MSIIRYENEQFSGSCDFLNPPTLFDSVKNSIWECHKFLKLHDVTFEHKSWESVLPKNKNDLIFYDPPYQNSDTNNFYFGDIDENEFADFVNNLNCNWAVTFNCT